MGTICITCAELGRREQATVRRSRRNGANFVLTSDEFQHLGNLWRCPTPHLTVRDTNFMGRNHIPPSSSTGSKTVYPEFQWYCYCSGLGGSPGTTSNYGLTMQGSCKHYHKANMGGLLPAERHPYAMEPTLNIHLLRCERRSYHHHQRDAEQPSAPRSERPRLLRLTSLQAATRPMDIAIAAPGGFELSTQNGIRLFLSQPDADPIRRLSPIHHHLCSPGRHLPWEGTAGISPMPAAAQTEVDLAVSGTVAIYHTLTAGGDGHGCVTLSPLGGDYISGTTVTLTPVANSIINSAIGPVRTPWKSSTRAVSTPSS